MSRLNRKISVSSRALRQAPGNRQGGMTLIELMISVVLGLIILTALINVYSGSSRSSQFSSGLQTMQENGRYGMMTLQRGFRLAGYSPTTPLAPFDLAAGDETTVVVQMTRQFDCNGESTAASAGVAINTYRFDAANSQITCEGNSASSSEMPLVEGVDAFRVLYGIDADGDSFAERYVSYDASIDPNSIGSVRFALLVNSQSAIRTNVTTETYVVLDDEQAFTDKISRQVFTGTVLLRNGS